MAKPVNVLFVTSELSPYAKESGVGDIAYSLPLALREEGYDVRVIIPKYGCISERKNKVHEISRLRDIEIFFDGKMELTTIKSSSLANNKTKVQVYIVTNRHFFDDRKGIYHDPITWVPYEDNCERFMFYAQSIVETCTLLGWIPDIIHCNDWQTAFLPGLLREMYPGKFKKTKIVFTIHNFYRQGEFDLDKLKKSPLPLEAQENYRHKHKFNFMKGALHYSDYITTVSPTYASEILKDRSYSNGLNVYLKDRKDTFYGIMNGLDVHKWNPRKDKKIPQCLESNVDEYKEKNKIALLKEFELEYSPNVPVIAMIPRIGFQKGIELFLRTADRILSENLQLIILGQGTDTELKERLIELKDKYPNNYRIIIGFDEDLSHRMEAGADFFLMPSQYEPFGLNTLFSLAYATIPIVRKTGGLADIVTDYTENPVKGNGFSFEKYESRDFYDAIKRALATYEKKDEWKKLIRKVLEVDYSWKQSVKEYVEIYKSLK